MIQQARITGLNNQPIAKGKYVLYWMQAAQRAEYNHALEYAIIRANKLGVPVLVVFGLTDDYPEATLRHYHFMLHSLKETQAALQKRGLRLIIRHTCPDQAAIELAKDACCVITDDGYTRIQKAWRRTAAQNIPCLLEEVTTNLIVPVKVASDKENFSAGTLRPRIHRKLDEYLVKLTHKKPLFSSLNMKFTSFDIKDIDCALSKLNIDRTVPPVKTIKPGTTQAKKTVRNFIKNKLDRYADSRNDPSIDATSNMSPYLHFGQISPLYIALNILASDSPGKEAYLEELIIRRELSFNFVYYNKNYNKIACLPNWARNTLNLHTRDKREYIYSLQQLEHAQTHDPYWNAAQKEMTLTGKMHGYMRMYWGKKILEWSKTPKKAFEIAIYLNNKYELDGRDPNGFAGIAWCFGKHDRAWSERKIFGKIRYMNDTGLKRKFDPDQYVKKIDQLARKVPS